MVRFCLLLWPCFLLLLNSCFAQTQAQTQTVAGIILDQATRQPVPFATIGVPGRPLGTVANEAGAFRLTLPVAAAEAVVVSSVGYEPATVPLAGWPAGGQTIRLRPDSVRLGEVLVRGGRRPACRRAAVGFPDFS